MWGLVMQRGQIQKIYLLDDELAKDGFDITDTVKCPNLLFDKAESYLRDIREAHKAGSHNDE